MMYRSWQHLIIQNETGLQDRARIKKLNHTNGSIGAIAIIGFLVAAVISLVFSGFLVSESFDFVDKPISLALSGVVMLLVGCAFLVGAWLFWKERNMSPLQGFLKNPKDFVFVKGLLEDCYYISGDKRQLDRIIVEGYALSPDGQQIEVREEFAPSIWNFTTPEAESGLKQASDWYEKKGQRRLLPVPAYFICQRSRPTFARLVAIDREVVGVSSSESADSFQN